MPKCLMAFLILSRTSTSQFLTIAFGGSGPGKTTVARAISPSNIEAATPSRWLRSAAVAIETNRWRSVFVIVTSGSEFKT
jgi:hypothetical protein